MSQFAAEALLLLVTALWGGTFAIIKTVLTELSPTTFNLYRFAIATVLAAIFWPRGFVGWNLVFIRRGFILGMLFGIGFLLQASGLVTTTATTSAFITSSTVVFVPFAFRIVERTRIRPLHVISVCFVIVGLYLFTSPGVKGLNIGDLLTLGSSLCWAVYITYIDVWTRQIADKPDLQNGLVILQFATTTTLSGVAVLLFDNASLPVNLSVSSVFGIAYCAIFASVLATWVQTRFQRFTHPVRAGIIFTAEPIFGAVIAWMTIGESMSSLQGIGALILVGAIVAPDIIVAYNNRRWKNQNR